MNTKILLLLMLCGVCGCAHNDDDMPLGSCDSSNTTFNQLYNRFSTASGNEEKKSMDAEVHAYGFEITSPETICKVGYQSLPYFNTTPYLIEIYDSTTSALLYSGSSIFSATSTSYIAIPPVNLIVGHKYSISRIQKNWRPSYNNLLGRLAFRSDRKNIYFPQSFRDLKITSCAFYGSGGPLYNTHIPYIDIVFQ